MRWSRERRQARHEKLHHAAAGILHQRKAGNTVALRRQAINPLHFGGSENFHDSRNRSGQESGVRRAHDWQRMLLTLRLTIPTVTVFTASTRR